MKQKTTYKVLLNDNLIYSTQNEKELNKFLELQRKSREVEIQNLTGVKTLYRLKNNPYYYYDKQFNSKEIEGKIEQRKYEIQTIKN